jgi:hypothetical protein
VYISAVALTSLAFNVAMVKSPINDQQHFGRNGKVCGYSNDESSRAAMFIGTGTAASLTG